MNLTKESQYARLFDQMEKEKRELYFLYNVFFVANGALLALTTSNGNDVNLQENLLHGVVAFEIIGFVLSYIWFSVHNKQRKFRDKIIEKIRKIEEDLNGSQPELNEIYWFLEKTKYTSWQFEWMVAFVPFIRGGTAKIMTLLPITMILFWILKLCNKL